MGKIISSVYAVVRTTWYFIDLPAKMPVNMISTFSTLIRSPGSKRATLQDILPTNHGGSIRANRLNSWRLYEAPLLLENFGDVEVSMIGVGNCIYRSIAHGIFGI